MSASARRERRATPVKCRTCARPMHSPLFCADCHTLHPADGFDHFDLLGFEPAYDIDDAELRRRYLRVSRDIHPDRHGRAATESAALSLRGSARLNEAYRVLSDPLLRAEYLLEVVGGKSSAQDKSVAPEVLTRTLAAREEIEEARAAGNQATLATCGQQVRQLFDQTAQRIGTLARQLPGAADVRHELRQALNAVKYYQKLLERL